MGKEWSYDDYQIEEGLKPGSKHFQYFFNVYRDGMKKCNYCVWIEDEGLSRFHQNGNFDDIISRHKESWVKWVQEKISAGDLNDKVLKFGNKGMEEIDLSEMKAHLAMD